MVKVCVYVCVCVCVSSYSQCVPLASCTVDEPLYFAGGRNYQTTPDIIIPKMY